MSRCVGVPQMYEVKNCVEYTGFPKVKCLRCAYGYQLTNEETCSKCEKNDCARCREKQCLSCFEGFLPNENGECDKSVACEDPNCNVCDRETGFCFVCKENYSLNKNLKCVQGPKNCLYIMEFSESYQYEFLY